VLAFPSEENTIRMVVPSGLVHSGGEVDAEAGGIDSPQVAGALAKRAFQNRLAGSDAFGIR
jgi:hypothetical protein